MANCKQLNVHVTTASDLELKSHSTLTVEELTILTRVFRGLKFLVIFWALGAIFVFVPIAHFFLVPACVLIGAFLFINNVTTTHQMHAVKVACLKCSQS